MTHHPSSVYCSLTLSLNPTGERGLRFHRHRRGQAVVETALASLVIVTVILFGIHFAEVGYASLKVHEAGAFAAWDATGRPMHSLPGATLGSPSAASARALARYSDFDSRPAATGASFTQTLTRADGLQVACALSGTVRGPTPPAVTAGVLPDTGGTVCSSSANVSALRIPAVFAPELFGASHVQRTSYSACLLGRPHLGACNGQLGILLGDWALSLDGQEANVPGNSAYESSVERIWTNNGDKQGTAAESFATKYAGWSPYDLPFEIQNDTEHTLTEVPGSQGSFLP